MNTKSLIISFDLDDTLFDNGPVIKQAFDALYEHMTTTYAGFEDRFDLPSFIQHAHETHQSHSKIVDFSVLRKLHIESSLKQVGHPTTAVDAAYQVFLDARQNVDLFADTKPMLDALRKENYQLISVSNGNADPHRIGLGKYFTNCFNPTNCGFAKPDPNIYREVCQRLAIKPEQLIHVGDCITNDYSAANEAGCVGVWFNVNNETNSGARQITRLTELIDLIPSLTD